MPVADRQDYLAPLCDEMAVHWPDNRTVNIVCHGHSIPSGYYATPYVDPFHAYPHLLHRLVKERFPYAVVNVIVTAIGGENARQGAARFESEVLCHRPDVLTIDYGLNDRTLTMEEAKTAWRAMIEKALTKGIRVILLTPSFEQSWFDQSPEWRAVEAHAHQIRALAAEYGVGLADTFAQFEDYLNKGGALQDLLCHVNHPGYEGHKLIATELGRWFLAR